jgi:hypothetical protein
MKAYHAPVRAAGLERWIVVVERVVVSPFDDEAKTTQRYIAGHYGDRRKAQEKAQRIAGHPRDAIDPFVVRQVSTMTSDGLTWQDVPSN